MVLNKLRGHDKSQARSKKRSFSAHTPKENFGTSRFFAAFKESIALCHQVRPAIQSEADCFEGFGAATRGYGYESDAFSDEELSFTEKNLRALAEGSRSNGVQDAGFAVRVGIPAHEIVEAAKELDIDLVVIGMHGYTSWKHFRIGSTAKRVVRAAPCPVFVVREKEARICLNI